VRDSTFGHGEFLTESINPFTARTKNNASINQTYEDAEFIFYRGLTEKFILTLGGTDDLVIKEMI
jgi:hypothetical protein